MFEGMRVPILFQKVALRRDKDDHRWMSLRFSMPMSNVSKYDTPAFILDAYMKVMAQGSSILTAELDRGVLSQNVELFSSNVMDQAPVIVMRGVDLTGLVVERELGLQFVVECSPTPSLGMAVFEYFGSNMYVSITDAQRTLAEVFAAEEQRYEEES